ncbi:Response regulator of zinc sigma-54-dependent two-component system [hydrothermal vent metagenome]|uniref:Response regulator of zinc sigma-54-dependent two-component system n=1 Tax=hydrothermal vent metagenome TaxID=652676 RepID=A0A3B0RCI5_9ZZZZ
MTKQILMIVEDDQSIRKQMKWALAADYEVVIAGDRKEALVAAKKGAQVVTLDLGLPPDADGAGEGLLCLKELLRIDPYLKVIIITGNTDKANAHEGISSGAYDYMSKPVDMDELRIVLKRAFHVADIEHENKELKGKVERDAVFEDILGTSNLMQEIFSTITKVAPTDVPVLITGESGTGKELVARAVHQRSSRKDGPFIAINCGAIPENLLESELFGHEKGAFTGAHAQKLGKVELANKGTIFFDEVGELPLQLQVKLLRFLQEQEIERIGGKKTIKVDVRVLAATNRDLEQCIIDGTFREDMYYRLALIHMKIPPLRERKDDVMLCAMVFLQRFAKEHAKSFKGFTTGAVDAIGGYQWPGNVRELENRIKRAVIMAEGKRITEKDLSIIKDDGGAVSDEKVVTLKDNREIAEKEFIGRALLRHSGNISRTATELGVSRPTLYDLMKKHGFGSLE